MNEILQPWQLLFAILSGCVCYSSNFCVLDCSPQNRISARRHLGAEN